MFTVKKPRTCAGGGGDSVPVFLNLTVLSLPGAKCAAIGAYVIEGGLSRVRLHFPLPFVDDELPLEMGQELEVLLLLGHSHHLHHKGEQRLMKSPTGRVKRFKCTNKPDTFSFPGKRLSNFFCREKVKVSQPMLEACLPCQKYTTHWKSSSGCLSSSSSSAPPPLPPPSPSFFSFSSSSYSTGTQYLRGEE